MPADPSTLRLIAGFAATGTALDKICADKAELVAARKLETPLATLEARIRAAADTPRGFARALRTARGEGRYGLIAEIKKASPSKGLIRADFDPPALARAYAAGGADCLSVLTDGPYFQGDDAFLAAARASCALPALRKDFMIDPYQIAESRALGADCVLLIMACLEDALAAELCSNAKALGMDVLIEVHDRGELDRALNLNSELIGINNRNLKTLTVNLQTTVELSRDVPADRLVISESGLDSPADLARMARAGASCFLIGESFMRKPDVEAAVRAMLAAPAAV